MNEDAEWAKTGLKRKRKRRRTVIPDASWLHTGSTLLNLAISGRPDGGIAKGRYLFFVGDSSSGKTFLMLTLLAEATINEEFDNHRLIFDNAEDGALMDVRTFFGRRLAKRLEPPSRDEDGDPLHSTTIEEFYFNLDDALDEGPCIYIIDSMDALSSDYEHKKFDETKNATRKGTKAKGDFGDGKAKINSRYIRRILSRLRTTGSILIVISQTRDAIDAGPFETQKTRSGGRALRFYSDVEVWSSVGRALKKTVKGKDRKIGITCNLIAKKNRVSGKEWMVKVPIYFSVGVDDIGSCVDFLADEGRWPRNRAGSINGTEDLEGAKGQREKLISFIQENELDDDVRGLATELFKEIEAACAIERVGRYK